MLVFFFFNDTATTEIYTLSLHDALPICHVRVPTEQSRSLLCLLRPIRFPDGHSTSVRVGRSEEHTSELQSQSNLVCRLLLEKKKNTLISFTLRHITGTSSAQHSRLDDYT